MADKTYGPQTVALHGGHTPDRETGSRAVPIHLTTSYLFRDSEHAANLFSLKEPGVYLYPAEQSHYRCVGEAAR